MDDEVQGSPASLAKYYEGQCGGAASTYPKSDPNYEYLPQLITSMHASHAQVFKSMEVIVLTHVIPSLGTLTQVKTKKKVQ